MQPRLELRREDQIHEDQRQPERDQEVLRGAAELARAAGEARAVAGTHVQRRPRSASSRPSPASATRPGSRPAKTVTCRCRFRRLISDGAVPGVSRAMFSSGTLPCRLDGTVSCSIAARRLPIALDRAHVHFVLLAAFVVGRHLIAADEQAQRLGRIRNLDAEVRRLHPIELHRQLRLADVERRVDVDDARLLPRRRRRRQPRTSRAGFRSGPLIVNWISALWLPPPPIVATGRTPVRRLGSASCRQHLRCAPRSSPRTDPARAPRPASAGRRPSPTFCVRAGSSATDTSVNATSGSCRIRVAIRFAMISVASRLVPSGARSPTSNSDWSSFGMKFLLAIMNSGTLLSSTSTATPATMPRCASDHCSVRE